MNAGRLLRHGRRHAGLTQRALAQKSGVPQPQIARIERGTVSPRLNTMERLLAETGATLELAPRLGVGVDRGLIRAARARTQKSWTAATSASPSYAAGHYALAAVYGALGRTPEATLSLNKAGQLDKANLEGRSLPTAKVAWQHYVRHGRSALLVLPK